MHDAHCHLDLYKDYNEALCTIAKGSIRTIAVTNAPSVFDAMERLAQGNRFVHPAIGLHPELVDQREHELPLLVERLLRTRFVGEVGLDFASPSTDRKRQIRVLERVLSECAGIGGKMISLHSRAAAKEVVQIVGPEFPGTCVLHWFSGTVRILDRAVENGLYFSINVAMTQSTSGRQIIAALPRERVLTESDGPFIKINRLPAKPTHVSQVVEYLADVWRVSYNETETLVDANFDRASCLA